MRRKTRKRKTRRQWPHSCVSPVFLVERERLPCRPSPVNVISHSLVCRPKSLLSPATLDDLQFTPAALAWRDLSYSVDLKSRDDNGDYEQLELLHSTWKAICFPLSTLTAIHRDLWIRKAWQVHGLDGHLRCWKDNLVGRTRKPQDRWPHHRRSVREWQQARQAQLQPSVWLL